MFEFVFFYCFSTCQHNPNRYCPQIARITATATGNGSGLILSATSDVKIADVVALTNNPAGLTVSVSSGNVSATNCTTPCLYSATTLDSLAISLERDTTALSFTGATAPYVSTSSRGASNTELHLNYTGDELLAEAIAYSETLTLTIGVN